MSSSPFELFRRNLKPLMVLLTLLAIFAFVVLPSLEVYMRQTADFGGGATTLARFDGGQYDVVKVNYFTRTHFATVQFLRQLAEITIARGGSPRVSGFRFDSQTNEIQNLGINSNPNDQASVRTMMFAAEARKANLELDDTAIRSWLTAFTDGRLSDAEINGVLQSATRNQLGQYHLYEQLRTQLLSEVFQRKVMAGLAVEGRPIVTPTQQWDLFLRLNRRAVADAYAVNVAEFIPQTPQPSPQEINRVYEDGKTRFPDDQSPLPAFRRPYVANIEYLAGSLEDFIDREIENFSEDQLRAEYQRRLEGGDFSMPQPPAAPTPPEAPTPPDAPTPDDDTPPVTTEPADPTAPDATVEPTEPASPSELTDPAPAADPAPVTEPAGDTSPAPADPPAVDQTPADDQPTGPEPALEELDSRRPIGDSARMLVAARAQDEVAPAADEPVAEAPPTEATPQSDEPAVIELAPPATEPAATEPTDAEPAIAQPTDAEPADAQPAVTEPTATEPLEDAPAVTEPMEDTPAETEPVATDPEAAQPFEEVRDEIARSLATQPALAKLDAAVSEVERVMRTYFNGLAIAGPHVDRRPQRPDLQALAERLGMTHHETGMVDARQIQEESIARSFGVGVGMQRGNPFIQTMFVDRPPMFSPVRTVDDQAALSFVSWKTEERDASVPALAEVRDEVILAIRTADARKLARARADQLATDFNRSDQPARELIPEDRANLLFESLGPFSWMISFGFGMQAFMGNVPELDRVGEEFMRQVFTSERDRWGVAPNAPETVFYVVRPTEFSPSTEELHQRFSQLIQRFQAATLAVEEVLQIRDGYYEALDKRIGFQWNEEFQQ